MDGYEFKRTLVLLSITGLLLGSLFNPVFWIKGIGTAIQSFLGFLHILPPVGEQIKSTNYKASDFLAVKHFNDLVNLIDPNIEENKASLPDWINENVYVSLVDKDGNVLADYQFKVENGKVICHGRTERTGGTVDCGTPTVWVSINEKAFEELYKEKSNVESGNLEGLVDKFKRLAFSGEIDVKPKSKLVEYLPRIVSLISSDLGEETS